MPKFSLEASKVGPKPDRREEGDEAAVVRSELGTRRLLSFCTSGCLRRPLSANAFVHLG
jgi:hypothetical protein